MTTIRIRINHFDEFEVPAPTKDQLYFTDDRQDAEDTARHYHGQDAVIAFRRGTYQSDKE